MNNGKIIRALVPGSFDPITLGHLDLILRAAKMFDETIVCGFYNPAKSYTFNAETRLAMLKAVCESYSERGGCGRITADLNTGLLADYADSHDISVIVKGARGAYDFDYEYSMAAANRSLCRADTIILPSKAELQHISSTVVRELLKYGRALDGYVPEEALEIIKHLK